MCTLTSLTLLLLLGPSPGGGGVLPYKGLMGMCGQPGYVFEDFCLKRGIGFFIFCLFFFFFFFFLLYDFI